MKTITLALVFVSLIAYSYQAICAANCTLAPSIEEGPYYVNGEPIRSNITEGQAGIPLTLSVTIIDVNTCNPIANAQIDVWQCSAYGIYSYYEVAEGVTTTAPGGHSSFLRGQQITDSNGVATFRTIYPGWYSGRTNHFHMKIRAVAGSTIVHTGQLFFDETVSVQVAATAPYNTNKVTRTTLSTDRVYTTEGGSSAMTTISYVGSSLSAGLTATATVAINTTAVSKTENSCTAAASASTSSPSTKNSAALSLPSMVIVLIAIILHSL
jgi:protocatechuate 3,4-dioxygenase beta subunit